MSLLQLFETAATDEEVRLVMERMVADGRLELIGDRDGEPVYALTEKGRRHADEVVFPSLGVTPDEAIAFVYEHTDNDPTLGVSVRDVAGFRPGETE